MVIQDAFAYSHIIGKASTGVFPKGTKMTFSLSMKTLALLALVVVSTIAIVQIEPSVSVEMALAQNNH